MNLQRIAVMIMSKKQIYFAKSMQFSFTIGDVSKVLYLAMFYYTNGQYEQSLKCSQRARPCSVKVKSINAMMRNA